MPVILGIDAAWTEGQPSGVALIQGMGSKWKCLAIAPSYIDFLNLSQGIPVDWNQKPKGSLPDVDALLKASRKRLGGAKVDVVAVDMPLSTRPIRGRREADNAISRTFGKYKCGVHSPNLERPGRIADNMREDFEKYGFSLATKTAGNRKRSSLLEVYPHTALLKLLKVKERVPYKISKASKYWPEDKIEGRRRKILAQWRKILSALGRTIRGIDLSPRVSNLSSLKRWEDAMDALVCAWMGIEYLAGRAKGYGDSTAAIWTPTIQS